jgi:hypothetical protein
MNKAFLLACCCGFALAQTPAAPVAQVPPGAAGFAFSEPPTKAKPYVLEGKMTVTMATPTFSKAAGGYKSTGSLGNEALVASAPASAKEAAKDPSKSLDDKSQDPNAPGSMQSNRSYAIQVPPGAKLMVQLKAKRLRNWRVRFVSENYGRTEDPGLFVNKLHHRDDAAFYQNKSDRVMTIHCVLLGIEAMENEPYALVFTDY